MHNYINHVLSKLNVYLPYEKKYWKSTTVLRHMLTSTKVL